MVGSHCPVLVAHLGQLGLGPTSKAAQMNAWWLLCLLDRPEDQLYLLPQRSVFLVVHASFVHQVHKDGPAFVHCSSHFLLCLSFLGLPVVEVLPLLVLVHLVDDLVQSHFGCLFLLLPLLLLGFLVPHVLGQPLYPLLVLLPSGLVLGRHVLESGSILLNFLRGQFGKSIPEVTGQLIGGLHASTLLFLVYVRVTTMGENRKESTKRRDQADL